MFLAVQNFSFFPRLQTQFPCRSTLATSPLLSTSKTLSVMFPPPCPSTSHCTVHLVRRQFNTDTPVSNTSNKERGWLAVRRVELVRESLCSPFLPANPSSQDHDQSIVAAGTIPGSAEVRKPCLQGCSLCWIFNTIS